ncbi:unnamed protein product [marine sediment metagenome]|uniref:Uncharacterized protein n=1 Tax=marine sediment metagenome TaxID=412755 RepID=X1SHX9_9ZZZZ
MFTDPVLEGTIYPADSLVVNMLELLIPSVDVDTSGTVKVEEFTPYTHESNTG